jgi:hypothetical protein
MGINLFHTKMMFSIKINVPYSKHPLQRREVAMEKRHFDYRHSHGQHEIESTRPADPCAMS